MDIFWKFIHINTSYMWTSCSPAVKLIKVVFMCHSVTVLQNLPFFQALFSELLIRKYF